MTAKMPETALPRNHALSIVLAVAVLVGALVVHTLAARTYCNLNSRSLQLAASMAARVGAQYLPLNPQAAMWTANRLLHRCGVASNEIISTVVSSDDRTLTIRLSRKVPEYVLLLALGAPDRTINVTASGQGQGNDSLPARSTRSMEAL